MFNAKYLATKVSMLCFVSCFNGMLLFLYIIDLNRLICEMRHIVRIVKCTNIASLYVW